MALDPSQALEFSKDLIDWFWAYGIRRPGNYGLPTGGWLRRLYTASRQLAQVEASEKNLRPACALWGPSATGKSTLLSNFLDHKVWHGLGAEDPVDGTRSALYWPGAEPVVFFIDLSEEEILKGRAKGVVSINPYTGGRDASAVLTRFVRGSLDKSGGGHAVEFPKYPVELDFLGEKQILSALALGYDSECLGRPKEQWQQKEWVQEEFLNELDRFNMDQAVAEGAPPDKLAYGIVHDLCEVLEDLVLAGVRRFEKLALSARQADEWRSILYSLLEQRSLISSAERAREFAGRILWDGSPKITRLYNELLRKRAWLKEEWGILEAEEKVGDKKGNTVHCTLKVAARLLNMDTYDLIQKGQEEGRFRLLYEKEGDRIFLGLEEGAEPVEPFANEDEFGLLQGLVWEMVMPVNFENLPPSPFRDFLERSDLLDFPGVSNDTANQVTRIAVWDDIPPQEQGQLTEEQRFSTYRFFTKILKRGKTASIVGNYVKRLTIDGFTLFLRLDRYPPASADQILTGINTWWKCMKWDYDRKMGGRSPLPLNLALTWWKGLFDTYATLARQGEEFFATKTEILRKLGRVSHAGVLWGTCALNYYQYADGQPADDSVPSVTLLDALLKEKELLLQFLSPALRNPLRAKLDAWETEAAGKRGDGDGAKTLKARFMKWAEENAAKIAADPGVQTLKVMLEDRQTGGAAFLFGMLCDQLAELSKKGQLNRQTILQDHKQQETRELEDLLKGEFMFPPTEPHDIRRETLEKMLRNLVQSVVRQRDGCPVEIEKLPTNVAGLQGVLQQASMLREDDKASKQPVCAPESEMRKLNYALREFLNINYADLEILPTENQRITEGFILKQYQGWIAKQAARWRQSAGPSADNPGAPPDWSLLGVTSPALAEAYLTSLVESIKPQMVEMARWLREEVRAGCDGLQAKGRSHHLPFLAVRMANALLGEHGVDYDESKPPSYAVLVEPFLRYQLPLLINAPVKSVVQVQVPGTQELEALCDRYQTGPVRSETNS